MTKQSSDPRDRMYERNLLNERRACAKLFNLHRAAIIKAAKKNADKLDLDVDDLPLGYASDPITPAQKFNGYDRNGRNSTDLNTIVGELDELATLVSAVDETVRVELAAAVVALKSFDVWYGALCRRDWYPSNLTENALRVA
ncbi:hypothetical protein IJ103_00025 [Candidatus Saccharibacteria bacterium]|nr:hypothetical protein [Candidatus Saccharibacteria bacterium]